MTKIKYLARKLKAFTFNEIFILAEMEAVQLKKTLDKLVEELVLKQDTQGYIYIEQIEQQREIKQKKKSKNTNFAIFIPELEKVEKSSFYNTVNKFLTEYVVKFCTKNTIKTYSSMFRNHILPYFKDKAFDEININDIKEFYLYCQNKNLSSKRVKNTMALLKQILQYAKNNGFTKTVCDFQVKRLSAKNEYSLNRIIFEEGACQCF